MLKTDCGIDCHLPRTLLTRQKSRRRKNTSTHAAQIQHMPYSNLLRKSHIRKQPSWNDGMQTKEPRIRHSQRGGDKRTVREQNIWALMTTRQGCTAGTRLLGQKLHAILIFRRKWAPVKTTGKVARAMATVVVGRREGEIKTHFSRPRNYRTYILARQRCVSRPTTHQRMGKVQEQEKSWKLRWFVHSRQSRPQGYKKTR